MKKFLTKIVTVLAIAALSISTFAGCGLITVNTEKDMKQVVATVQYSDEIEAEEILKKEMKAAYMSYGYYYVASYGYTESKAYALILDNLISNRIVIQGARIELAKLYNELVNDSSKADTEFKTHFLNDATASGKSIDYLKGDVGTLKKYLTDYEIAEAEYEVKKSINSLIESYKTDDEDDEDETEDETFTARASAYVEPASETDEYELAKITPSDYDYKVADVTINEGWETLKNKYTNMRALNLAVYKAYEIDLSNSESRKAFNKAIKSLKKNGLIEDKESFNFSDDVNEVLNYSYFADILKSQYESAVVAKYEASLHDEVEGKITDEILWTQYCIDYYQQQFNYTKDRSAYETALDEADEDTFVICNPYDGETYGYVANLLIGFTDEQTALLSDYAAKAGVTSADKLVYRNELLANLVAKDQRETWAQSNYGSYSEGKITFESKHFASEDSIEKLGSFIGTAFGASSVTKENDDKVEETTWSYKNLIADAISFDTFVSKYLAGLGIKKLVYDGSTENVGKLTYSQDLKNRFDDLIYAFSTDSGSLGKYYGYTYSPKNSATTYVKEFADAAKALVEAGEGAYTIVATDYGYHVMLCTKVINGHESDEYKPESDKDKFIEDLDKEENTFAKEYFKTKFDSICDDEVSKIANKFINDYKNDEKKVKRNRNAYSDLIDEADESDD